MIHQAHPSFQLKMLELKIQKPLIIHYHIKQKQGFGKLNAAGMISEDHLLVWKMKCLSQHYDLLVVLCTVKVPSLLEQADVHNIYSQNI